MSTAAQYRKEGYTVAFWGERVWLYKPGHPVMCQKVDKGYWMYSDARWEVAPEDAEERLVAIRAACYCGQGGVKGCDFCQGVRRFNLG